MTISEDAQAYIDAARDRTLLATQSARSLPRRTIAADLHIAMSAAIPDPQARHARVVQTIALIDRDFPNEGEAAPPAPMTPVDAPSTLDDPQAARYLQTFADEFAPAGITTPAAAAAHWSAKGRAEWLAGDPNRRRFTP